MDTGDGYLYANGDFFEYETGLMYYADGTTSDGAPVSANDPGTIQQAQEAAEGGWLDNFTEGLLKLGTTAAQIAMLYQNVESSRTVTPAALQSLQQERIYLQQQTQSSQTMWMWVAVAAGAALVISRR